MKHAGPPVEGLGLLESPIFSGFLGHLSFGSRHSGGTFQHSGDSTVPSNQYESLMRHVYEHGTHKSDRTGTGTRSVFGYQMRFNLADFQRATKLPSAQSLRTALVHSGGSASGAHDNGVTIWDEWADENGDLGPVYGVQWRSWPAPDGSHVDQIENLMQQLRTNPDSRRMIVCAWNPGLVDQMALPPCHCLFQFYVADGRLSCQLYQRSCDIFLGVPFNIASYALLTHMVAQQAGLEVGDFVWTGGDCHLYDNHMEQTDYQLRETASLSAARDQAQARLHLRLQVRGLRNHRLRSVAPHQGARRRLRRDS